MPIGTGGMATVFIGRSRDDGGASRLVALKRAHSHVRSDAALVEGMKREARLASRLHHANVVSVLDVEEDDGDLVLVLDYVEGCTLRTLLLKTKERLGELRPRETLRIILDVAAGLHAAHQTVGDDGRLLGLVHRDVSPSNVLVGVDGVTRISDFGIAKAVFEGGAPGAERTEAGILKGKSSYMAPEYVMHQRASAASDLFSLAVMTWEALAATRLFKGVSEIDTLKRVAEAQFRPLAEIHPDLAAFDVVLARALSRLPGDRHASVQHFAIELEAVARSNDLVASHLDVATLVARVMKQELDDRRRALGQDEPGAALEKDMVETVVASVGDIGNLIDPIPSTLMRAAAEPNKPLSRDDLLAATVPQPFPPPASKGSQRAISVGALKPIPAPPAPASSPTSARSSVRIPSGPPSAPVATQRTKKKPARRSRGREVLALLGAFALLGLALAAMAWRLKTGSGFDDPTPATTPAVSASSIPQPLPVDFADASDASSIDVDASVAAPPAASSGKKHPTKKPPR